MRVSFSKMIHIKDRRRFRHKLLFFAAAGIAFDAVGIFCEEAVHLGMPLAFREVIVHIDGYVPWLHITGAGGSVCGAIAALIGRLDDLVE